MNTVTQSPTPARAAAATDVRTLVVSLETAVDAVLELDGLHGGELSAGRLVAAHIEDGADPSLVLVYDSPGVTREKKKWPLPAVAAALVRSSALAYLPLHETSTHGIEAMRYGFRLTVGH